MKKILILSMSLFMFSCATPKMTQEQQQVRPISIADNCEFIKTAYFEVSHPSKIHYYAAKNTVMAGGDSYQIMNSGNDMAVGMKITTTNIGIYKCKK